MAECAFHPGVETELRCTECERYICPKDMVETPVGYKCRECAAPVAGQHVVVKPNQLLRAIIVGGVVGIFGGIVMAYMSFGFIGFFLGFMWGTATAEATRRASGGHRQWTVGIVAVVAIGLGAFAGAAISGRLALIPTIVAVVVALADLALLDWL
jgi:hypothetical protein